MRNTVLKAGVAVVVVLPASAGCANTPGTSLTKRKAMTVVNGYLRQTFRALPVKITRTFPLEDVSSCMYFGRRLTPTEQITPGVEHVTETMGPSKGRRYLSAVATYWSRAMSESGQRTGVCTAIRRQRIPLNGTKSSFKR